METGGVPQWESDITKVFETRLSREEEVLQFIGEKVSGLNWSEPMVMTESSWRKGDHSKFEGSTNDWKQVVGGEIKGMDFCDITGTKNRDGDTYLVFKAHGGAGDSRDEIGWIHEGVIQEQGVNPNLTPATIDPSSPDLVMMKEAPTGWTAGLLNGPMVDWERRWRQNQLLKVLGSHSLNINSGSPWEDARKRISLSE